ncbi:tripartite tricarboxylate transporter TctB family protein [Variovorax sp. LjRoot84]|uniref:tripartite tricarboxylate transporter TctB family protein n=1 Tax=Variovorax sp. LjRoot84 TaxID=3342340 RepID=UPI003ED07423
MSESEVNGPGWHALATVGVVLFGLAAVISYDVTLMAPAQAVGVGPTAAMRMVAVLLIVLGLAHVVAALRVRASLHGKETSELDEVLTNRAALGWVLGGLIGMILILQFGGGFIVGSTWLFAATARAFGQPIWIKSPAIGFVLAALVYAFFTKALSLSLPAGPLERLLLS